MTVLRFIARPEIDQHRATLNEWLKDNGINPNNVVDNWLSIEAVDHQRVIRYQAYKLTADGKRLVNPDDPNRAWTDELTTPMHVELFLPEASENGAVEPRTLNPEQAEALHRSLIDHQHKTHTRTGDVDLLHVTPLSYLRPPPPACPACGETPETVAVKDCRITLDVHVDFTPCGHGFRIPDHTMQQLARLALDSTPPSGDA